MRLLKQLVKEFWLPFLIGVLWSLNRVAPSQEDAFGNLIANFATCFFLASWAAGQILRVRRQHTVEDSFKDVERQLAELKTTVVTILAKSAQLHGIENDAAALRLALDDISTLSNSATTEVTAANTAVLDAIAKLENLRMGEQSWPSFVLFSSPASVGGGSISILAIIEVLLAVVAYWVISLWFGTFTILWVSLAVSPLLLLRSNASVALGVQWAERYVDHGLADFTNQLHAARPDFSFWLCGFASVVVTAVSAYILSNTFHGATTASNVAAAIVIAYIALQLGASITIAAYPRYLGTIAASRGLLVTTVLAGTGGVATGSTMAGVALVATFAAVAVALGQGLVSLLEAPRFVTQSGAGRHLGQRGSVEAVRVGVESAPVSFVVFAPAIFFGGWLQSLVIRIVATIRHLGAGVKALPDNWWRTLFVVDLVSPPELVPGYRRHDFFNLSYFISRIRESDRLSERYISAIGLMFLYLPAYLYRMSIKLTFWLYWPLVYIVSRSRSKEPEALRWHLLSNPMEWWRRVLMVFTLAAFFLVNTQARAWIPPRATGLLEYIFLYDPNVQKPWQLLMLLSALLTFSLAIVTNYFSRTVIEANSNPSPAMTLHVKRCASWISSAMFVRNLAGIGLLATALLYSFRILRA